MSRAPCTGPDRDGRALTRIVGAVRGLAADALGRLEPMAMVLLADLRTTYVDAQQVEIDWVILLQAARAARDGELVAVIESCREESEHTAAWLRTRIKDSAAQVLATR